MRSYPSADVQIVLYASVDEYVSDLRSCPELAAHVMTAVDYKDGATLLEKVADRMATRTLRPNGVCLKAKTPAKGSAGVFVETRRQRLLRKVPFTEDDELHFENRCHECEAPFDDFFDVALTHTV